MSELDLIPTLAKVGATFALLFVTLRLVGRFHGANGASPKRGGPATVTQIEVVARQTLGRNVSVVVTRIGDRLVALGVGPNGVNLVCELDRTSTTSPDDLDATASLEAQIAAIDAESLTNGPGGPTGSPLSGPAGTPGPFTSSSWKGLVESLRDRTVRH